MWSRENSRYFGFNNHRDFTVKKNPGYMDDRLSYFYNHSYLRYYQYYYYYYYQCRHYGHSGDFTGNKDVTEVTAATTTRLMTRKTQRESGRFFYVIQLNE